MDIYGIDGQPIIRNLKLNADCRHEEEMMKSNFVKLSFRHSKKRTLPVGANILVDGIRYVLLDPYTPTQQTENRFLYEPEFQHPIMWLGKLPFIHKQGDTTSWATTVKKFNWTYTGVPATMANEVARYINWLGTVYPAFGAAVGTTWRALCTDDLPAMAQFVFDSVDIFSAAAEMANVCECEYHFDFEQKIFHFGTVSYLRNGDTVPTLKSGQNVGVANVSQSKEAYFNCFVVKGGTRNISQQSASGDNVQVTERLSLDETKYPDSVIDIRQSSSEPKLFKELIFDDIYPRMELYLYNPRERRCWLIDSDTGEKIETTASDGWYDPETQKYYKYYSKWYVRLAYQKDGVWHDYTINPDTDLIKDKPLSLSFQPNYDAHVFTSPLVGREFELVYFNETTTEKEQDDIEAAGFTAQPGDYRIVFLAGDTIIPSTSKHGLCPKGYPYPDKENNIVTLFNIVVDEVYKEVAKDELEAAGKKAIARLQKDLNTYNLKSNPVYFEKYPRTLYVGQSVVYSDGQDLNNGGTPYTLQTHIRKIVTRLDKPECMEISVGNEQIKGSISSLSDKVDELSNGLIGGLTEEQFDDLVAIYGGHHFLSKEFNDVAQGIITFLRGAKFGNYREGEKGASINGYGDAEFRRLVVRLGAIVHDLIVGNFEEGLSESGARIDEKGNAEFEALVTRALATLQELLVKGDSVFGGNLSSPDFISGFPSGTGWALQKKEYVNPAGEIEYKYVLECDGANIRGTLRVYEFIISQLLGENDNRIITAMMEVHHYDPTTGKVWLTTNGGRTYNVFRKDDCIKVQQYQPGNTYSEGGDGYVTKSYELLITAVGSGGQTDENGDRLDWVEFSNFTTDMAGGTPYSLITKGDTFCRLDNLTDAERKGIIELISIGTNAPYIDIIYGLKTDPDGYLKGRLGNLQGIHHHLFGWLQDFGEYLINAYIVGDVRLRRTGESLDTAVEIVKGLLATKIAETVFEITDDDNFLRNANFTELNADSSFRDWTVTADAINFYTLEGSPVISSVGTFADVKTCVKTEMIDGKQVLHIVNGSLRQSRLVMKQPGTHKEYDEGESEQTDTYKNVRDTMYLGVRIHCIKGGTLTIGFPESTMTEQNAMKGKTQVIERGSEWVTYQWQGTWDGQSDFVLRFTGECYLSLLSLTDEPLSTFKTEYSTQIKQTSKNIALIATRTSANETNIAQLEVRADQITSTVQQNYTTLDGKIGENTSRITQTATEIRAEVTAVYDDLDGRVKENASSITQTATAIRLEVKSVDDKVDDTIERVGALEVTDTQITARVSSVETTTSTHSNQISGINTSLTTTIERVGALEVTDTQIAARVSTVETRSTTNSTNINSLSGRMDGAEGDIDAAEAKIISITTRVGALEVTSTNISGRVATVETTTSAHTSQISGLNSDVSGLESDLSSLDSSVSSISSRVGSLEIDSGAISQRVAVVEQKGIPLIVSSEWEQGTTDESPGDTYDQAKASSNTRIRSKRLFGVTTATFITLKSGYQADFVYFRANQTVYSTTDSGWKSPDSNGRVYVGGTSQVKYVAILLRKVSGAAIAPPDAENTNISITSDSIVSQAEISTFIEDVDGTTISHAHISADCINLEGYTTINNGFSVDLNGNVTMNDCTVNGKFNGEVKSGLFYNSVKELDGSYTINLSRDKYTVYVLSGGNTSSEQTITLPSASSCKGLELTFFCEFRAHTRSWVEPKLSGTFFSPTESDYSSTSSSLTVETFKVYKLISVGSGWSVQKIG